MRSPLSGLLSCAFVIPFVVSACTAPGSPAGGADPERPSVAGGQGGGEAGAGGTIGGAGGTTDRSGSGGRGGEIAVATGGAAGSDSGGSGGTPPESMGGTTGATDDAAATADSASISDTGSDGMPATPGGGPQPPYEGEVPIYYGAEVGPPVTMQCPGDPTAGYTEYKDSFHIERPYDVPITSRFTFENGIYTFWVFPNDKAHSTIAHGKSPRTEAAFGGTYDIATIPKGNAGNASGIGYFTSGKRIYSADVLIEKSATGSITMQLHTTATGIGPVYMSGGGIPGGMVGQWFNLKIAFDASTLKSQIYINNCPKGTVSGPRGDGHFYFKHGIYHCGNAAGCKDHFKNVHFYIQK